MASRSLFKVKVSEEVSENQVGFTVVHSPPPAACWEVIYGHDGNVLHQFWEAEDRHVLNRWCLYEMWSLVPSYLLSIFTYCLVLAVFCFRVYGKAQKNRKDIEGDMRSMSITTAATRLGQVFLFL